MELQSSSKLVQKWYFSLSNGTNVILMRHAPKAGSNNSDLTPEGEGLALKYGVVLKAFPTLKNFSFFHTSKKRTSRTLGCVFPQTQSELVSPALDIDYTSAALQEQVNNAHRTFGHPRGYYLNHTYYFLEELGIKRDAESEHLRIGVPNRMLSGLNKLVQKHEHILYCGHSPQIEATCEKLLGLGLPEIGGFLNPLDSLHLRHDNGCWKLVARINPIVGYIDLESETFY